MANDFYSQAAIARANMIDAQMAASQADLAAARANNDIESASTHVQELANLRAEKANLTQLYNDHQASQQPRQPEPRTQEEIEHLPWNKMTPDDALQLAKTSKYGRNLDWNDPHVRAGYVEAQNRRHRGE